MSQIEPLGMALGLLFVAFPSGVTDAIKSLYLGELRRQGVAPEDAAEAAQRILHTRESRTVPPLAEILRRVAESRADRLKRVDESETLGDGSYRLSPADAEQLRNHREMAEYGVFWCGEERNYVPLCRHGVTCNEKYPDSLEQSRAALDAIHSEGWKKLPVKVHPPGSIGAILQAEGLA
jgi:hypothetical protein